MTPASSLIGYTMRSGDKLVWKQKQSVSYGGVYFFTTDSGGTTGWILKDQNGEYGNDSMQTDGAWHSRVVDLSSFAGKTISQVNLVAEGNSPAGNWVEEFADIAVVSTDGTVQPIYNGTIASSAFLSEPFGDAQLTLFGSNGDDVHFTGKERDAESGNDNFGARYYASSLGRFVSPDWSVQEEPVPYAKLDNPQSLNLYSYVLNNPLTDTDANGHDATNPNDDPNDSKGTDEGRKARSVNLVGAEADRRRISTDQQQNGQQGVDNSLKYKTVTGGQKQGPWEINWSLKHNSKKGGFIVQHIVADFGDAGHFDYYEAWPVAPGTHTPSIQGVDGNGNLYSDMFSGPAGSHIHGSARFYEGLNLPDSFTVHPPGFPAGILRSTTTNPNLPTDNATAPNVRWWGIP